MASVLITEPARKSGDDIWCSAMERDFGLDVRPEELLCSQFGAIRTKSPPGQAGHPLETSIESMARFGQLT